MLEHAHSTLFDLDQMLVALLRHIRQIMPCHSAVIYLYDSTTRLLIPHAQWGSDAPFPHVSLGQGVIGLVGQAQELALIDDTVADPRSAGHDPALRSQIAVPILYQNRLFGVLNVESHPPQAYTPAHVSILEALAAQTALVLYTSQEYRILASHQADLLARIQTRRYDTQTMQRLAAMPSATSSLDDMLTDKLRETAELLECEGAQLWLPNHVAYVLEVHEPSLYGLARTWSTEALPLDSVGYLVRVYHTGLSHVSHTPPPDAGPDCHNVQAYPLNTHNRTLGVLHLLNQASDVYDESQNELAQTIANQIAVGINSAQMFADERRRTQMLTQLNDVTHDLSATLDPQALLPMAAQAVFDVLGHEAVHVFLLDPDRQTLRLAASAVAAPNLLPNGERVFRAAEGVVGRTIRTGKTQSVPDVRHDPDYIAIEEPRRLQSCLTVPLHQAGEVVGAIDVLSARIGAFDRLDQDALETLAIQVSTTLQNAQLYHQVQRRLLEQTVVHQIGQDLSALLDFQELCRAIVQHMCLALDTSSCLVIRYEPEENRVRVEADFRSSRHRAPHGPLLTGEYLSVDDNAATGPAIMAQREQVFYLDDEHTPANARALLEHLGDYALLIIPMIRGGRVLGAVEWTDNRMGRKFTPEDLQLARTLVTQATIALDNALLFSELEARARQLAEANQLRTHFLAMISHELRTPMNSIIGFTEMLLEKVYGDLNERQTSRLDRIRNSAYHLLALIDDLLDLSSIEAGRLVLHLEMVSIGDALLTAVQAHELQAETKGLKLECDITEGLPRVQADPQRLYQVIANLLSNAIKFTHSGSVTVRCRQVTEGQRTFVQTSITDTGIGISKEHTAIIFDEFRQVDGGSTREYGGTGMGLSITKKLVELMGGTIRVESEINRGSIFTFTLPAIPAARARV
jgi:signal transduction histidine kinase/putative methionine-R-sulfoxide reductase with GAF domain